MEPVLRVVGCWLLFGGLHIGLATRRVRAALVAWLGEWGFIGLYSTLSAAAFALLILTYAAHRFDGPAGLGLGGALRGPLMAAIVAGVVLTVASLVDYPRSPMAVFGDTVRNPHGIGRITRHGFLVGLAMFGLAHAVLATRLVGTVAFGMLGVFTLLGAWHQDRKLLARRGASYAAYLAQTSTLPFAAIVAGRQHIAWTELRPALLVASVLIAYALRTVHESIFARGGIWVVVVVLGGAALEILQAWRRSRPSRTRGLGSHSSAARPAR
jgi:uncharacterized membrane protein